MTISAATQQAPQTRPLDRMDDWPNDDLLLKESAQNLLDKQYSGALRVFDWPELRKKFEDIDVRAGGSRKRRRRNGVIAASATTLGAVLSAILPLAGPLGWDVERVVYALAAALSVAGFFATLWLVHADREVSDWLESRLQTERLRQLYFQFMGSDPALAARAFTDDTAFAEWTKRRDAALLVVAPTIVDAPRALLTAVIDDVNQTKIWLLEEYKEKPGPLTASPNLDKYFEVMRRQRIGVQRDYIREKMAPGLGSPETWHSVVKNASYITALAALLASVVIALLLYNGATFDSVPVVVLVSLVAFIGVIAMFVKLLGEGLQVRSDAERYSWYRDAINDIDARYNNTDPNVRVELLRKMERASYREMREFLKTHKQARFSFG